MKIHYTKEYLFDKGIHYLTVCGIVSLNHKNFIDATICEGRVNCKSCKKILKKDSAHNGDDKIV
jgi:hypothetical protein